MYRNKMQAEQMKKRTFYTEVAYLAGLILLAFSAALMEAADFGVSMVVAPAYLLHLKLVQIFPFFSFGMAEYTLQAVLLILTILVLRRFKWYYLFSFVTAVLYGFLLDGAMTLVALVPADSMVIRILFYGAGLVLCSSSVAFLFHTYIAPEVYELFVKELAAKYSLNMNHVKTVYDCTSCLIAILMSFAFFGLFHFEGVKLGTVLCALVNGWLIGAFSRQYEKRWTFKDRFPLRRYFE